MIKSSLPTSFFDRDLSWLKFNERVLDEASRDGVPLLEKIKFLSIFSSNLDEFYRVRMPVLLALEKLGEKAEDYAENTDNDLIRARKLISEQQKLFGNILNLDIIPALKENHIQLVYGSPFPDEIKQQVTRIFLSQVMSFLQPVEISASTNYFPSNNDLYFLITLKADGIEKIFILNIPSSQLARFFKIESAGEAIVVFLDDIIRFNLHHVFKDAKITGCFSFKITRDAEIDLKDEYSGDLSDQIERQLLKRDSGLATRFLHEPGVSEEILEQIGKLVKIKRTGFVEGGRYHNLKDLMSFPVTSANLSYIPWQRINQSDAIENALYPEIQKRDIIVHTPYQSYDMILRFFNEAAVDPDVNDIRVTLYRVASDSKIVNALISAAKNGKKVVVLVELKARFDEANNIKWAKKMKTAGVEIIYSVTALKVHAKIALVKRTIDGRDRCTGLLSTGNFNESTASFYTDHILMTANKDLLREMELLFIFLAKRIKPRSPDLIKFNHLLVAQFNLQNRFLELIEREITYARQGKEASIIIKINNLEERVLINKLYEASEAGVKIHLIVRSICCLVPGIKGMSENIYITRIVDRYLEHGRIFTFHNGGQQEVYLGSADWMNRNIYRRIEVCFPIYDPTIRKEIIEILAIQLRDNKQAVEIGPDLLNARVDTGAGEHRSQQEIYNYLLN